MKLSIIFVLILTYSCKTPDTLMTIPVDEGKSNSLVSECPEDGKCNFKVMENSSISIIADEFGSLYPQFHKSSNTVLAFEYKRNEEPNVADDGYQEFIYLELNNDNLEVNLKDSELQNVKLLFARLCFCRGQTGYYKVTNGHLKTSKGDNDNDYSITLSFEITEVPQIIHTINETFQLNK